MSGLVESQTFYPGKNVWLLRAVDIAVNIVVEIAVDIGAVTNRAVMCELRGQEAFLEVSIASVSATALAGKFCG